jgi:hypothetical protein
LRKVNLVRMCDADFTSINREQLAGFLLRHRNRLSPVLAEVTSQAISLKPQIPCSFGFDLGNAADLSALYTHPAAILA